MSALPVVRVAGPLHEALGAKALATIDTAALAAFLGQRRWFGAKGRTPKSVKFGDVVPLPFDGTISAMTTLEIDFGGQQVRYQLPLAVAPGGAEGDASRTVLAAIESADGPGVLFDATGDATFREALGQTVAHGARFEGVGAAWIAEPVSAAAAETLEGVTSSKVGSAEQSNTSIVYGGRAMLKLFRKLEAGEHPDAEIARFLTTRTSFRGTPELLSTLRIEDGEGSVTVAGMMQRFVPGAADAWGYALEQGRGYFGGGGSGAGNASKAGGGGAKGRGNAAESGGSSQGAIPFAAEAGQLGRVTREMHEALASVDDDPDFAPVRATEEDLEHWADAARESVDEGLRLLAERLEAGGLPADRVPEARALAERGDVYHDFADELADRVGEDAGMRIRHHGDFHLGQVIRGSSGDLSIIDFEGEPARPLAARREKQSALRDVAGMLRSFAYAASTLASERRGKGDARDLESVSARWERAVREAFLTNYLGVANGRHGLLPDKREGVDALIALFELEKTFYELGYELNNRPDWVWIPMRGAARLLYR